MVTRRLGSTLQYADGWDRAFGKGTKTAKKKKATKGMKSTGKTTRATKKAAKKKTKRGK